MSRRKYRVMRCDLFDDGANYRKQFAANQKVNRLETRLRMRDGCNVRAEAVEVMLRREGREIDDIDACRQRRFYRGRVESTHLRIEHETAKKTRAIGKAAIKNKAATYRRSCVIFQADGGYPRVISCLREIECVLRAWHDIWRAVNVEITGSTKEVGGSCWPCGKKFVPCRKVYTRKRERIVDFSRVRLCFGDENLELRPFFANALRFGPRCGSTGSRKPTSSRRTTRIEGSALRSLD